VMQVLFCNLHSAVVLADNVQYEVADKTIGHDFVGNSTTPTKVGRFCHSSDIRFTWSCAFSLVSQQFQNPDCMQHKMCE